MTSQFLIAFLWLALPTEAFHLPEKHPVVPTSLFSRQESLPDDPLNPKGQSKQPRLRRYQGGMIRPKVVPAKPEPTSDFVKLLGQDVKLYLGGTGSSGMFKPTPEGAVEETVGSSPQSLPVDESAVTTLYISGGLIEERKETKPIPKEEDESETIATQNEAAEEQESLEEEETEDQKSELEEENDDEALDEEKDLESSEEITEAEMSSEVEDDEETVEEEGDEEAEKESIVDESSAALEKEEDEKLEIIQAKIEMRKQQQAELEKMEEELLRKTEEIKMRKEELLRMEEEVDRAESEITSDSTKDVETPESEATETIPHYSPEEYNALSHEEKGKLKEARDALRKSNGNSSGDNNHILGPVIADLGYKRIHIVSSGRLGTIPVWKKQRTYKFSRVHRMAAEKEKQMHLGFPGIICLYEDSKGKLSIIDGQHRVGMMQALRESRKKKIASEDGESEQDDAWNEQESHFQNILVEVYSESSAGNAIEADDSDFDYRAQIFQEINKAEPMALVDEASKAERKVIADGVSILKYLYPDMFITSKQCRPPNTNANTLRNIIVGSNLLKRHQELTTGKKLADWLVMQNAAMGELYETDSDRQELIEPEAWTKASKNGFYLGLDNSWLYR